MQNFTMRRAALVLVGPSGAGKSTLLKRLEQSLPGRFGYSISHTTRDPRAGEVDGQHYHFVNEDKFKTMIDNQEFLEYAVVHKTTYYGTSFKALEDVGKQGLVATMDLDIVGAQSMRKSHIPSCIVFIEVPSLEILEQRLRDRATESEEKIAVRMESARKEMDWFVKNREFFDIALMNDNIDECFAKFRSEVGRICFGEGEEDADAAETLSSKAASTEPARTEAASPYGGSSQERDASTVPADSQQESPEDTKTNNSGSEDLSAEKAKVQEGEDNSSSVNRELKV